MPRAASRPSAIAQTMSDWPRVMSPAVNTPGTLVILVSSALTLPRSVNSTPSWATLPSFPGPRNPIASSSRSTSTSNSVPGVSRIDWRPFSLMNSTRTACSFLRPPFSPDSRLGGRGEAPGGAAGQADGVELRHQLAGVDIGADVDAGAEDHAFGLHLGQPPVNVLLLHLELGDAVAEQAADAVRALEHGDGGAGAGGLLDGVGVGVCAGAGFAQPSFQA